MPTDLNDMVLSDGVDEGKVTADSEARQGRQANKIPGRNRVLNKHQNF